MRTLNYNQRLCVTIIWRKNYKINHTKIAELSDDATSCNQFTVDDLDIEILPLIYEIIRSVEKDPYDTTQKAKESQDTSQKILELQKKFDSIKRLPGIEYSKEEQLKKLETLRKQLRLKRELLFKYRNMCSFEIPKN
ncbi:mediator of RNA polymerase II transcription subunit 9 isoform X2 [Microplitis mediator]|uniref:mediator of RNA polymerase II transcription subunit 9 isoform X2 n=1 Tax=Microplitis mediator TaxID=375433 RepID=UPI002555C766|nr:mediator of RNA polymerase II transcription subunit 9 isoform X2 [Microplitis mediator]